MVFFIISVLGLIEWPRKAVLCSVVKSTNAWILVSFTTIKYYNWEVNFFALKFPQL